MSLETVVEDIRDEAESDAAEIVEAAETEAEEIVAEAEAEAEAMVEDAKADAEAQIEREREQRLSSATLEAKQRKLEARREALETVRTRVEAAIESLEGEQRETLTRELLEAGAAEFGPEESVDVFVAPDDQDLVASILEGYDDYELAGEYDCLGGVVLEGEAGNIRINNTFDSVLEAVWDRHVKEISEILFEEQ